VLISDRFVLALANLEIALQLGAVAKLEVPVAYLSKTENELSDC
jgi:hypothetical protein